MTPEFLAAVIDTLLPGDSVLPSGTGAGLRPDVYATSHRELFAAVAARAGNMDNLAKAGERDRTATLQAVEMALPDPFRALLTAALSDYYESPAVLTALGWPVSPPQPAGHIVSPHDGPTAERSERVRHRGALWRD